MSGTQSAPDYPAIAVDIGLDLLRTLYPSLTGAGVTVGQVEASEVTGGVAFEADSNNNTGASFTYVNGMASTTTYNDGSIGAASSHANYVATFFYASTLYQNQPTGIASGVSAVDIYDANSFLTNLNTATLANFAPKVVNMSFTYSDNSNNPTYDADAAKLTNTVFVAAAGNSGTPASPSTAWNVISVSSSTALLATGAAGSSSDKPDISAPQSETSWTAAIVSGVATILVQAGTAGLTGWTSANKTAAVDARTIKALLLNGAVKPSDYFTNSYAPTPAGPLSAEYGSGVVNVYNSVVNLYGGQDAATVSSSVAKGGNIYTSLSNHTAYSSAGWNLGTLSANGSNDGYNGYALSLTANTAFVATVTWFSHIRSGTDTLDKIDLYIYDEATGTLQTSSTASSSSVQQIYFTPATAGRYDIYLRLEGGSTVLQGGENYALAFAETNVACFAAGTHMATLRGEVAVEDLREGDMVTLARDGTAARVRWVGSRSLVHPDRTAAPLRIAPGAFGPGQPCRDLLLSPEHAVYAEIDGTPVLVPVRALENSDTVVQTAPDSVTYFHILLDRHDVLLAEGLACESLFDAESAGFGRDLPLDLPDTPAAPRLTQGPLVEALRQRLTTRAERSRTPHETSCAA